MILNLVSGSFSINDLVIVGVIMIFALIFHNVMQAWMASRFGDRTPQHLGFFSFDPQRHLEPIGLLLLLILGLGWAVPVAVNSRNYKSGRNEAVVWYSGVVAFFLVALICYALAAILLNMRQSPALMRSLSFAGSYAIHHAVIYMFPVWPLDGARAALALDIRPLRNLMMQIQRLHPFGFILFFYLMSMLGVLSLISNTFRQIIFSIIGLFSGG